MIDSCTLNSWASQLAERDGHSWTLLPLVERDRYRDLAAFVFERIDQGDWVQTERYVNEETIATTYERQVVRRAA